MSTKNFKVIIPVEANLQVHLENHILKVKGPKGEVEKKLHHPFVKIEKTDKEIILSTEKATKKEKRMINTFRAHINNMIKGVNQTYIYKLKVCSSHFPITATLEKNKIVIKNFMGEKIPRKATIQPNVTVKVAGDLLTVESPNKEAAGQTAINIEKACRRPGFDTRVFADGIWMIHRAGKDVK